MKREDYVMKSSNRAIVIFDTRFGNTEKIAKSFEAGLRESDVETVCLNAKEINPDSLNQFDLISVGAPTEWLTASKPMKEFLERLRGVDLRGKYGFAFDTKLGRRLSGSAAKLIEKDLKHAGLNIIADHESAIVYATGSSMDTMTLKDGEEKRFEAVGRQIGALLAKSRAAEAVTA